LLTFSRQSGSKRTQGAFSNGNRPLRWGGLARMSTGISMSLFPVNSSGAVNCEIGEKIFLSARNSHTSEKTSKRESSGDDLTLRKDAQCIERALRGDISGFQELVERYERRAYAIALSVIRNPDDAKDIAQEAFIRVYQKLEGFKGESSFYTWLYRIVFNLAVDLSRKRYRTREIGFVDPGKEGVSLETISESEHSGKIPDPAQVTLRAELSSKIETALQTLSPEHRAVIVLREMDGLSYSEIAESVQISKGTVMSRLHHARKRLQLALREFSPINQRKSEDLQVAQSLLDEEEQDAELATRVATGSVVLKAGNQP